jgi:hypothetical protein
VLQVSDYGAVLTGDVDGCAMIYTTASDDSDAATVDVDVGDRVKVS